MRRNIVALSKLSKGQEMRVSVLQRMAASLTFVAIIASVSVAWSTPDRWRWEWKQTNFDKHSIDFSEIMSGGPPKDGIPAVDDPTFVSVDAIEDMAETEPVIGVVINGKARAYPLSILIWHEIVNDELAGVPITVTFCPLCNAAVVFDRRLDGQVLDFGTTGKLRNSDLVMYDRQTESWWQQFLGEAIVGDLLGKRLTMLPARLESFAHFKARAPKGEVLVPNNQNYRRYGANPYQGYDTSPQPFLYRGSMPSNIGPLDRVVSLGEKGAWSWTLLRQKGTIETADGIIMKWEAGQNSALDSWRIADGRDVGNVTVQRAVEGKMEDVVYGVDFAFAYHAFYPNSPIHVE